MSRDPIDKWLDALEFENYRLSFWPSPNHADMLESQILELESQPIADMSGDDLDTMLQRLENLKQDLASARQLIDCALQVRNLREQMRQKGILQINPDEADEALDGFHSFFEKSKIQQRERQWRNLTSLKQFWPHADGTRRRRMANLFATYTRRRLLWGTGNLAFSLPLKIRLWATRK